MKLSYFQLRLRDGKVMNFNKECKIITNVDELVGEDFASHFGEYEDDSVFSCN